MMLFYLHGVSTPQQQDLPAHFVNQCCGNKCHEEVNNAKESCSNDTLGKSS